MSPTSIPAKRSTVDNSILEPKTIIFKWMFGETPTLERIFRVPGLLFVGVAMFVGCGIGNWRLKTQY